MPTVSRSESNNNSSSFQSDLLKSNIKFRLTSCNTETIEKLLRSTKPVSPNSTKNINNTRIRREIVES